ncbi:SAM-dependent methyltransferase [Actinocorallia sp. API 0066]|uniref:SAM-dependent methyltransferase n=1 Tax=Actinocorallia sp. API 0066 TaxID=2896846 RepID=UPI001E3F22DB|nr:SAM-dependent methyltransferase [Actinocorallia sp. API 0066]MCD0449049.1 SAM-dependent methyltransferase [Actinocorallia sp. API 0066]
MLALSHMTSDGTNPDNAAHILRVWDNGGIDIHLRDEATIKDYFNGLHLLPPGVIPVHIWNPESAHRDDWFLWSGLALKQP